MSFIADAGSLLLHAGEAVAEIIARKAGKPAEEVVAAIEGVIASLEAHKSGGVTAESARQAIADALDRFDAAIASGRRAAREAANRLPTAK